MTSTSIAHTRHWLLLIDKTNHHHYINNIPLKNYGQKTGKKSAASLDSLTKAVEGLTEKLDSQFTSLKHDLNTAISGVTNEVIQVKDDFKSVHSDIDDLCKENIMLKTRLIGLETYSRRDNLRFGGIPEKKNENPDFIIRVFLQEQLHITDCGDIKFVRIHRVGQVKPEKHREIIVRFHYFGDRMRVWKKRSELKGTRCNVREDFAPEVDKARSLLYPYMLEARRQGKYATLVVGQLLIDGTFYDIDVKTPHVSQHSSPLTVDILPLYAQYSFPGRTQTHLTTSSLVAPLTDGSATLCRIPSHRSSAHYHQSDTRLPKHTTGYQLLRCTRPHSPRSRARRQSLPLKSPGF